MTALNLTSLTLKQGFSITGANKWSLSGFSVSGAGDINKDGYDDIVIGAPGTEFAKNGRGISYVIYGGPSISNIDLDNLASKQGFSIMGSNYMVCYSVSGAGDMNKDGYDDIIIGTEISRKSYVIYGGASLRNIDVDNLTATQGFSITRKLYGCTKSLSAAGDVNGDGYDDIILGGSYKCGIDLVRNDPDRNNYKRISYVIYGAASLSDIDLSQLTLAQGFSIITIRDVKVSGAGDVNGDGYDDIVISPTTSKKSYIIYGGSSLSKINIAKLKSTQGLSIIGNDFYYNFHRIDDQVARGAGDVNKDGYDDIIVGVHYNDNYSDHNKAVFYVVYGNAFPSNIDLANLNPTQGFFIDGFSGPKISISSILIGSAGDINKDGYADIIIGNRYFIDIDLDNPKNPYFHGSVFSIVYGKGSLGDIDLTKLISTQGYSIEIKDYPYGIDLSGVKDVNKDGYDDIIISTMYAYPNDNRNTAGISYVIYGNESTPYSQSDSTLTLNHYVHNTYDVKNRYDYKASSGTAALDNCLENKVYLEENSTRNENNHIDNIDFVGKAINQSSVE